MCNLYALRKSAAEVAAARYHPAGHVASSHLAACGVGGEGAVARFPEEVEHLANVTIESWVHLRRDGGMPVGEDFGAGPTMRGYDLPPSVFFGLKRWVRPTPAA